MNIRTKTFYQFIRNLIYSRGLIFTNSHGPSGCSWGTTGWGNQDTDFSCTKSALAEAKAKGTKLGGARPNNQARHKAVKALADQNALRVSKLIKDYRSAGKSYRYIAEQLNELGVATVRTGKWFASTVRNYDLRPL